MTGVLDGVRHARLRLQGQCENPCGPNLRYSLFWAICEMKEPPQLPHEISEVEGVFGRDDRI